MADLRSCDNLVWAVLGFLSVMTIALLLGTLRMCLSQHRSDRRIGKMVRAFRAEMAVLSPQLGTPGFVRGTLERLSEGYTDFLGGLIGRIFDRRASRQDIDEAVNQHVTGLVGNALGWLNLIQSAATLTGLCGTILGVQSALHQHAISHGGSDQFILGFALAMKATLLGTTCALAAFFVQFLLRSRLHKTEARHRDAALEVMTLADNLFRLFGQQAPASQVIPCQANLPPSNGSPLSQERNSSADGQRRCGPTSPQAPAGSMRAGTVKDSSRDLPAEDEDGRPDQRTAAWCH